MKAAGIDITKWFFPTLAKYAAHAQSVVAANSWLLIPTYVQIIEKSIVLQKLVMFFVIILLLKTELYELKIYSILIFLNIFYVPHYT